MARAITGAAILFTAQTGPAEEGFKRVRGKAQGFGSDLGAAGQQTKTFSADIGALATRLAGAAAAFLTVRAAANAFFSAIDRGAEIQAVSDRLGIASTELQAMRFAADQLEVSASDLDGALARMNRRLGRAAAGGGPAAASIEALGLSIGELLGMPVEQRFVAIADALSRVGDEGEMAGIGQGIFGTQVDALIPIIREGREEIEQLIQAQRESGKVLSEDATKAAAEAKRALEDLNQEWGGLRDTVALEVAPAWTAALGVMAGSAEKFFDIFTGLYNRIGRQFTSLRRGFAELPSHLQDDAGRGAELAAERREQRRAREAAAEARQVQERFDRQRQLEREITQMNADQERAREIAAKHREEDEQRQREFMEDQQRHWDDMVSSADRLKQSLRTPFERAVDDVRELREMMRTLGPAFLSPEAVGRRMAQIRQQIRDMVEGETPGVARERGVGGVRLGEAAGFSALQEARRNERTASQERQRQTAVLGRVEELMSRLVDAVEQGEEVSIDMVDLAR